MNRRILSAICAISLAINGFCLASEAHAQAIAAPATAAKTIVLTGNLTDQEFLRVSAASGNFVLLIDRPNLEAANLRFVQTFRPDRMIPVGITTEKIQARPDLSGLGFETVSLDHFTKVPGQATTTLVVCPAEPRSALLQATCLAAENHADLCICDVEGSDVANVVGAKEFKTLFAVGAAVPECNKLWPGRVSQLVDAKAVATAYVQSLRQASPVCTLIVTNPADLAPGKGRLSSLAPWVAHQKACRLGSHERSRN